MMITESIEFERRYKWGMFLVYWRGLERAE